MNRLSYGQVQACPNERRAGALANRAAHQNCVDRSHSPSCSGQTKRLTTAARLDTNAAGPSKSGESEAHRWREIQDVTRVIFL